MTAAIVIPARFGSTRLPGKPLLRETGRFLIQHVVENALRVRGVTAVIVATDNARIADAVTAFGGVAAMTRPDHPTGSDRIAEVAATLDADIIVNLQGDEPHIDPAAIEGLIRRLERDPAAGVATLRTPIRDGDTYASPNCVKVVCDDAGRALYFSRSPVPFVRDGEPDFQSDPPRFFLHLGVYAYRRGVLLAMPTMTPHFLERTEMLEQLRLLAAGVPVLVDTVPAAHHGIDTPADYAAFVAAVAANR